MRVAWPDLLPDGRTVLLNDSEAARGRIHTPATVDLASGEDEGPGACGGWGLAGLPSGPPRVCGNGRLPDGGGRSTRACASPERNAGGARARDCDRPEPAPAFAFSENGTLVRATGYLKGSAREPMRVVAVTTNGNRRVVSAEADL